MIIRQCVRSGFCCKNAPCAFGAVVSNTDRSCRFLEVEAVLEDGETKVYRCGRYEEIKDLPGADVAPAFGAGCCQPMFNTDRRKIIELTIARKQREQPV